MTIVGMDSKNQLTGSMQLISKDIACNKIVPLLTLQETGRLRQTSRWCNALYNAKPEHICPFFKGSICSTRACLVLADNFYACTKALAHCAHQKDAEMFNHWWRYHAEVRFNNLSKAFKRDDITVQEKMKAYCQYYSTKKDIKKKTLHEIRKVLKNQDLDAARMMIVGSCLQMFDLIKKNVGLLDDHKWLFKWMLVDACRLNDSLLVQAFFNGSIDREFIELIMEAGTFDLLMGLIELKALNIDVVGNADKTLLHYAAEYNMHEAIKILIDNGIYVNCTDRYGMKPLHYAAKNKHIESVIALLASNDADARFTDNKGKTAVDYVSYQGWESGDDRDARLMIKELIKAHIKNVSIVSFKHDAL
jgi:hypothetical protein